ncbi:MAG: YncE family protein [Betaproteobacteria bacterium]
MKNAARFLLAAFVSTLSLPLAAIQQTQTIKIGKGTALAVADPLTGRVFTANVGAGRFGDGKSIGILERDGTVATIPTQSAPAHIAIGVAARRVLVTIGGFGDTGAQVVNADTLQAEHVATGPTPTRGIVVDRTNRAYVIGRNNIGQPAPWLAPGTFTGTLTEIDLATNESHVYPISGMYPEALVADPDGGHVYVVGYNWLRTAETLPNFVSVFDTGSKSVAGPMPLGRRASAILADGPTLYVVGHEDLVRPELPLSDMRRNGVRHAIYALDAASLALRRTIELAPTDAQHEQFNGVVDADFPAGRMYLLDFDNQRLEVVDLDAGTSRVTGLESAARGMGFNPVTGNVVVTLPMLGQAAIFSAAGERIDTVPLGAAAQPGEAGALYGVTHNPATGVTYVANTHDGSLTLLPPETSEKDVVNLTGLWWNPAESGWGLYLEQQGATVFGALFTHDANGTPAWMVMSDGKRQPDGSFAGALYRTTGPREQAIENLRAVGTMRFTPASANLGALGYEIDGVFNAESLQRQVFAPGETTCRWTAGAPGDANFTSLWFDPAQPGWGLALTQQGETAFGVLFGFDAQDRPSWTAMTDGEKRGGAAFGGALYRAPLSGPVEKVGSMALDFGSALAGHLAYELDGLSKASPIARQRFGALVSDCSR